MATMTQRPRLQDMVKAAMQNSLARVDVGREAARQAEQLGEKLAEETCSRCKKASDECSCAEKKASPDYALKLAAAVEFIAGTLAKEGAQLAGPYQLTSHLTDLPPGVSQATASTPLPAHQGQGHHIQPMHPPMQKGRPAEQGATQMANNLDSPPGGNERMVERNQGSGKSASVIPLIRKTASRTVLTQKTAEDAINPARISAGAAVPPETSEAGQAGGQPVGGAPQGPTSLVGSNEAAQDYTKGQAYANRKADLGKYFAESALSSSTDKTLAQAFEHTSEAGTKISSAPLTTKTAVAKALLAKLTEQAEQRSA